MGTYGSPITKESPALIEGTSPSEPTKAAAASLWTNLLLKYIGLRTNERTR